MLIKKLELLAIIVGSIIFFLMRGLIWEFLLNPLQAENTVTYGHLVKEQPIIWIGAFAQIPVAILLTLLYSRYIATLTTVKGAVVGAMLCSMFNLSANLMILSQWNLINAFVIVTDVIGAAIIGAIGGATIAWILTKKDV